MKSNKRKNLLKRIIYFGLAVLIFINIIAAIQAYSYSHFRENVKPITKEDDLSAWDITRMLFTGVEIARPTSNRIPGRDYKIISIPADDNKILDAWLLKTDSISNGIVILFHGYMAERSSMLEYGYNILDMGYDIMLVDFMGAGNSYGNQSTIGALEAENVKAAVSYTINTLNEKKIYLMGFSMGAAAIIKSQSEYNLPVRAIIAEASYGKMLDTIDIRAKMFGLGILSKPASYNFLFWLGCINGFNAYKMNPEDYVKNIHIPLLIACGGKDQYIPQSETKRIYDNAASKQKFLKLYPDCAHELYLEKYPDQWRQNISSFLDSH